MLKFWDNKPIMTPEKGELSVEQVHDKYQFSKYDKAVMEIANGVVCGFSALSVLMLNYNIDESLSDDGKLAAIAEAIERQRNPPPDGDSSADIAEVFDILKGVID